MADAKLNGEGEPAGSRKVALITGITGQVRTFSLKNFCF